MKVAVRYVTRSGNTKKLADAIGQAAQVPALPVTHPLAEPVDLLFLGGSVYGGGVDSALISFIGGLASGTVKKVAVFSTAAITFSAYPQIKRLLAARGIAVESREYHCRGKFAVFHRNRPDDRDCAAAAKFAADLIQESSPNT
ncbi:MAG: flavodoxin [Treponema sp.]|jgi:flavodoxin|nr:flavodoxin [Treponema sp.]